MAGLPREILKWMQSLDLSYSIRNVKRDFCNGFLVAEIFNRYYKQEIQMHSFDNGTSMTKRKDNWELLEKFFTRMEFDVTRQEIDDVIHCKDGAAAPLICKFYRILTGKEVQYEPPLKDDTYVPAFARPTASLLVKQKLKDPKMIVSGDTLLASQEAAKVLESHNDQSRQEKITERERFTPAVRASLGDTRLNSRPMQEGGEASPTQVQFTKEVSVRQLDDSAIAVRTISTPQAKTPLPASGSPANSDSARAASSAAPSAPPVQQLLAASVQRILPEAAIDGDAAAWLTQQISGSNDDATARILNDFSARSSDLSAEAALANPREFWAVITFAGEALLRSSADSRTFRAASSLLESVGQRMLARDTSTPWTLFTDLALPKLSPALIQSQDKRAAIIRIAHAFSSKTGQDQERIVNRLREIITDADALADSIAILLSLEKKITERSAYVYVEYALSIVDQPSESVRAAALAILSSLAFHSEVRGVALVLDQWERIVHLQTDPSSTVQAQLVATAASILENVPASHPAAPTQYGRIRSVLEQRNPSVVPFAVAALTRILDSHPTVRDLFLAATVDDADTRYRIFGAAALSGSIRNQNSYFPVQRHWHPLTIVEMIVDQAQAQKLDNLRPGHVELISFAVSEISAFPEAEGAQWRAAFNSLRAYLLVELYDETLCNSIVNILNVFLHDPSTQEEAIKILDATIDANGKKAPPPLFGVLKLVFGSTGKEPSQRAVYRLLSDALTTDPSIFHPLVFNLLRNFADHQQQKFQASLPLQELLRKAEVLQH